MTVSYEDIAKYQWVTAMSAVQMADVEVARMIYWCKSPDENEEPDLITMIALWTEADDKSQRIDETPIETEDDDILSLEDIRNKVAELDGFMISSELHRPDLYQATINKQIKEHLSRYRDRVLSAQDGMYDEYEWDDLLDYRDTLEYARMGINVIKMKDGFPKVKYHLFARGLAEVDKILKKILKNYPDREIPPYAPSTAWWRKK